MPRRYLSIASLAVCACQPLQGDALNGQTATKVEIDDSRPVEASDLMADGGSFGDSTDPFWGVSIHRSGIDLNGAASPAPPSMTTLPPVRSTISGATESWTTEIGGQKVRIQAIREKCIRPDGFVFRQRVTVRLGTRVLVGCGQRGGDPEATKG